MPSRKLLGSAALDEAVSGLHGWSVQDGKLHREYQFPDFVHAFGFMATAALEIEKLNHHPEWTNVYNRIRIDLVTHDAGGITELDVTLAGVLDRIAAKLR